MGLMIFSWIVLLTILGCLIGGLVWLGLWPGKVAQQRQHPYTDAIAIGSWVALVAGGILWPLILIWAYAAPLESNGTREEASA